MSKFLILGGAGFIGSNFTKYILNKGHEAIIVDNLSTGSVDNLSQFSDNEKVKIYKLVSSVKSAKLFEVIASCDYIIHLAASVGVQYVEDNPHHTMINNLDMEKRIFKINEEFKKPIFFASTSEVYGEGFNTTVNQVDAFRETDTLTIGAPTQTRWGYACSKLMGEFLLHSYTQPFVIGRFFNVTSRNQLSKYGMVLPSFVEKVLNNEPLTVYGIGNAVRCYCHIDDAVDAIYKTITNETCYRQIFNIGNPVETSVYDLARKVVEHGNGDKTVPILFDKEARCDTDIKRRVPNIDKIKNYINWAPKKNLDTIILDMINYKRRGLNK